MLPLYKNQERQNTHTHTHVHACLAVKYDLSLNDVSINYFCKYTLSLNDAQKSEKKKNRFAFRERFSLHTFFHLLNF